MTHDSDSMRPPRPGDGQDAARRVPDDLPPPIPPAERKGPWIELKNVAFRPAVYPPMIRSASREAEKGDLVHVFDPEGRPFGSGFYNPGARVPLRMLHHGPEPIGEDALVDRIDRAVTLRREILRVDEETEACRIVNSDGDGLGGLVVDRYADVLSVEVTNFAAWRRLPEWLPRLHQLLGTTAHSVEVSPDIARIEMIPPGDIRRFRESGPPVRRVRIRENGVRFEVDFTDGHKTGFFCDQRANRRRLAALVDGRSLLDLCCYTGGFAVAAGVLGRPGELTGVDLDEKAIAQARRNANLNQLRVDWVHADAFTYARQMQRNGRQWDAVVVDPPKFVVSRQDRDTGVRKYRDLNALAVSLTRPGGLFVTCSCSGLLPRDEFESTVIHAAQRQGRRLQILDSTGAGPDHPVFSNALDGRYLKVLWAIAW